MRIGPTMCLGELAERMGQTATREEAEYLREVLCETNPGEDTADIPEQAWQHALRTAMDAQLADEIFERDDVRDMLDANDDDQEGGAE